MPENAREMVETYVALGERIPDGDQWQLPASAVKTMAALALRALDYEAASGEVTWHQENARSYTAHLGALYVGTLRDWTPDAQRFPDPAAILAKPWRATFSSDEESELELGRHATEAEAKKAVERKIIEALAGTVAAARRKALEEAAKVAKRQRGGGEADNPHDSGWQNACDAIEAAIRALGRPA